LEMVKWSIEFSLIPVQWVLCLTWYFFQS